MLEPVTWPHPPMNNHFAPFKPFQSPCHNHLAKEKRSITPSRPHYTVSGLMTASSVLAGFMFRPSPMFLLLHRLTGWFLCLFISTSVSQCQSHCSRSWWYTWSVRVCSVDGETVPGMSVGSQWVVLPRYSCLFYKAVRSNEGLHTNHLQQRRKHARPLPLQYAHIMKQKSVQWRRRGGKRPLEYIHHKGTD